MYGKNILKTRKEHHKTQIQVSMDTGLPQTTLSWIEKEKGLPNIQQCEILANYYNISIDELIGRDKYKYIK